MRIITRSEQIKAAIHLWQHYFLERCKRNPSHRTLEQEAIHNKLMNLNIDTATADDIKKIAGDKSWCERIACDICTQGDVEVAAVIKERTKRVKSITICLNCINAAKEMADLTIYRSSFLQTE